MNLTHTEVKNQRFVEKSRKDISREYVFKKLNLFLANKETEDVQAVSERAKYGISKSDAWGLCSFITKVMIKGLKHLAKKPVGHPSNISYKKWKRKLKQFIKLWKDVKKYEDGYISVEKQKKLYKSINKRMPKFWKYYFDLWD